MTLSLFHLHGDLRDLRFPRLLAALRQDRFTGVFQATTPAAGAPGEPPPPGDAGEVTREVHFLEGRIAWAISTEKDESLRAYMVRNGALTPSQWAEAELNAREGTVRDSLVSLGMVSARELTQIEKGRAEEILLALFPAREGEYRVRERQLSPGTPDLKIDPRPLILKGVLERGDQALVMEEVGSLDAVYTPRRPAPEEETATLPGEFQSVLKHIDGRSSIARICSLTSLPENFVCSVVAALGMIGAVRKHQEKASRPAPAPETAAPPPARLALSETPVARAGPEPAAAEESAVEELPPPPIAARPFVEPPFSFRLEAVHDEEKPDLDDDREPDTFVLDAEPAGAPAGPSPAPPSFYDAEGSHDSARPWFLLGGGAAVGLAALFLLLMGHGTGDAGEVIRPVSEAAPAIASDPAHEPSTGAEDQTGSDPLATPAAIPQTPPARNPENDEPADNPDNAPRVGAPVAPRRGASILRENAGSRRTARENLQAGDYIAAARQFGREVTRGAGGYTIQLMTACQDETLRRAVQSAGGSSRLFILSTSLEGRSCYRVYWGKYPSQARAREALRREVPEPFLRESGQPRVTRLGGA